MARDHDEACTLGAIRGTHMCGTEGPEYGTRGAWSGAWVRCVVRRRRAVVRYISAMVRYDMVHELHDMRICLLFYHLIICGF